MNVSPYAGKPADASMLVNVPRVVTAYYPNSLDVIEHVRQWEAAVLLTDGDVVFQPRKVDRSGLYEAVDGHVLI